MRRAIKFFCIYPLLAGLLLGPLAAYAQAPVLTVSGNASPNVIVVGQGTTTMTVTWRVQRPPLPDCGNTVTSAGGLVHGGNGNGPLLLTVPTTLSQTVPCQNNFTILTFVETIVLPADVIRQAQQSGFGNVVYIRTFTGLPAGQDMEELSVPLGGSAGGSLNVARLAVSFDNGAPARVLAQGEALGAVAEVTFTGTGLLQAQWELAGPESTSGTPIFRVLSQVRQYLTAGDTRTFRSPPLPTNASGLHFVRLRITDPPPGFETPTIRYFVLQAAAARDAPGRALALGGPPPRALLAPGTSFTWDAIRGARAYQLEIYDTGESAGLGLPDLDNAAGEPRPSEVAQALSRPAATGVLVAGNQTRASLSPMVRQHLLPGHRYLWRVLALGADGSVLGVSPMRELRTP